MRYDDWKLCYPPQYDDPGEYLDFEPEPNYDREDFAAECEREARGQQSDGDDRGDT